ncbi:PKD domain-containing protein [Archangium violaceum]|uniref:PKD domain-containing protein n=1 Tax=Archangium violaceum TaxID=83451 RepID=UPI002B2CFD7B|nr:PKD domain-containing protein [Archangium violaceum]
MKLHVRASLRALTAFFLVAVALVGPGCRRAVKPEAGEDRTVEAGVPEGFGSEAKGAPEVRWDFGDGTPPQLGARVSHAFPRAGTFTVRALKENKDEVLASATVTVVPRPVLRAIPPDAEVALFFPQLRGNVEPLVDFVSRLLGEAQTRRSLEEAPLLSLVLSDLRGQPRVVDPEEGVGFFSLPGFEGTVALLGVTDTPAALDAVVKELESGGARVSRREPEGSVHLQREGGAPLLLFPDRGYLYLVVPDTAEPGGTETVRAQVVKTQAQTGGAPADAATMESIRARITGMSGPGMSEVPLLTELRSKVGAGNVHLFARAEGEEASSGIRGLWAALKVDGSRADLEGWVASEQSLFEGKSAPGSELLGKAPAGPFAALMVSIPPEELAKLVFGAPGSERRARTQQRLLGEGFEAAEVDSLLGALRGDLTLLAYFDAAAFYRNFIRGSRRPEPRGTLLFQAGLVRSEPVLDWLTKRLQARKQPFEVIKGADATRLRTRVMEQPVELTVSADRLTMHGGESLAARAPGDVGAALRERFDAQAFTPGHLSAMVDVGRLRAELDAPQEVPGVPSQQLPVARSLVGTLLDQLPPIELVFLDFAPEQGGGRFRARTQLRSR